IIGRDSTMAAKIDNKTFDFWIKHDMNVLLEGPHGTGKTTMVIDAFERNNVKYKVFSASTLDPWVDFVGIPKDGVDPETGEEYIRLVKPKDFARGEVEFIFLDEFNRAPTKIKNAVME
ncbi:MAG: ATP-binding protein, partial [Phototrophicales bacterium]